MKYGLAGFFFFKKKMERKLYELVIWENSIKEKCNTILLHNFVKEKTWEFNIGTYFLDVISCTTIFPKIWIGRRINAFSIQFRKGLIDLFTIF